MTNPRRSLAAQANAILRRADAPARAEKLASLPPVADGMRRCTRCFRAKSIDKFLPRGAVCSVCRNRRPRRRELSGGLPSLGKRH